MNLKQWIKEAFLLFLRSVSDITKYHILVSIISYTSLVLLKQLAMLLLKSTGRVAVSTGDFGFLFSTWQGPLLIIIALVILFIFVAFDLNGQIIFASTILEGKPRLLYSLKEGFLSIRSFFTIDGVGIILYIALIAPLIGFGFTISLTDSLYLPNFIASVIDSVPAYKILYFLFLAGFIVLGVVNIFTLHGILLGHYKSYHADNVSRSIMKKHWKDFFLEHLKLLLFALLAMIFIVISLGAVPLIIAFLFIRNEEVMRIIQFFFILFWTLTPFLLSAYSQSFYLIHMTKLYYRYTGEERDFVIPTRKHEKLRLVLRAAAFIAVLFAGSFILSQNIDKIFDITSNAAIIAHRGGGIEAPENTVTGINKAIELGAYGSEIDVQRTKDNYYIINHDANFSRLCGTKARPEELTIDEVKELILRDPNFPGTEDEVATLEEMLDAAKGKIVLFVELKGMTADQKMADDVIAMIKEKKMEDQCVLISLKYSLIDYIERNYPEMNTGYLTFLSLGKTEELNCDYLGLEEEAASSTAINTIQESKHKVMVWTPNTEKEQRKFLTSPADYIITDYVSQAMRLSDELDNRNEFAIIEDWLAN